ncbi:alpha/beta hydrolase-fold protein [Dactylosporangium sp. NPDC005555]|uniref:alpha/beta hydrolase n=1 Tax=Dactylosporangium sp. NPDC005555 TaxID=3154889 RepID=UPI0033AFD470
MTALCVPVLGGTLEVRVVSPAGGAPVVLVAHDGPSYEDGAALSRLVGGAHVALLSPGDRNEWYSANPAYADALVDQVLPRLPAGPVVGLGASLGALAMLHAEHRHPGAFDGLFLQSGSFFTAELDPQESGFPRYRRILDFVENTAPTGARTVLTCGLDEENLHNNRAMARRLGVPLVEVPGGHNMTTWRHALRPHLPPLLREFTDGPSHRPAARHGAGLAPRVRDADRPDRSDPRP